MLIKEPRKAQKYTKYKAKHGKAEPDVMAERVGFSDAFLLKAFLTEFRHRLFA